MMWSQKVSMLVVFACRDDIDNREVAKKIKN